MKRFAYRCLLCLVAIVAIPAWIIIGMAQGAAEGLATFCGRFADQWWSS